MERNVLTVTAQRPPLDENTEFLAAERPRGVFSRQLVLGDNLDLDRVQAGYRDGVLQLIIPVAEKAKPRKITINRDEGTDQAITTGHNGNGKQRSDNTIDGRRHCLTGRRTRTPTGLSSGSVFV